jgi:hypothetical protein
MDRDRISEMRGDFVSLAEQMNKFINENVSEFKLPMEKDEINLQFEDSIQLEGMFPLIIVGNGDSSVGMEKAVESFKKIKEQFNFKTKTIMAHGSPVSKIKHSTEIHVNESNPMILLNMEVLEEGYTITLNYNSTIDGKVRSITESLEPFELFNEEELLMEGIIAKGRYNKAYDKFASIMRMQGVKTLNLIDTFDQGYLDMMERRFTVLNKKGGSFYTSYKYPYEQEMLMRHFVKVYNLVATNKSAKEYTPMFSILFHKGQAYPLLVVGSNKYSRIIGVYCLTMQPKDAESGSYLIGKAELFRSPLTPLNKDVLFLRKALGALYFS